MERLYKGSKKCVFNFYQMSNIAILSMGGKQTFVKLEKTYICRGLAREHPNYAVSINA